MEDFEMDALVSKYVACFLISRSSYHERFEEVVAEHTRPVNVSFLFYGLTEQRDIP
jgi:hypothetical protein